MCFHSFLVLVCQVLEFITQWSCFVCHFFKQKYTYTAKRRKPEENDDKTGIFCKQIKELVPFTSVDSDLSITIQEDVSLSPIRYYAWRDHMNIIFFCLCSGWEVMFLFSIFRFADALSKKNITKIITTRTYLMNCIINGVSCLF